MLLSLLPSLALAVPVELPHQGRLLDGAGLPLTSSHNLTFALYDDSTGGSSLWSETQPVLFEEGYYDVALGLDAGNPIPDAALDSATLYLGVTVDGGTELERIRVGSVAYARRAAVATSVSGGVVDASEIRIGGNTVIDGSGDLVGGATLEGLTCVAGELPLFDGVSWDCAAAAAATVTWDDIVGKPPELVDGDDDGLNELVCADAQITRWSTLDARWLCADDVDTQLSESSVETYIVDGPLDFAAGSTVGGAAFVTDWTNLPGIPTDLADGSIAWGEITGMSASLADGDVDWTELTGIPGDLSDGTIDWAEVTGIPGDLSDGSIAWAEVTGIPADIADGDADDWSEIASIPSDIADGDDEGVTGTGTADYVPVFSGTEQVGDSPIYVDGGNVAIGGTSAAGALHVEGDFFATGGVDSLAGRVRRDFATYNTTTSSSTPIHIKTNIPIQTNIMFRILVEGYNYGAARSINSDTVGYTYSGWPCTGNIQNNNYANGVSISQYCSSDGYVVVRLDLTSTYFIGFSVSAWMTNPTGTAFDIEATQIVRQSANL